METQHIAHDEGFTYTPVVHTKVKIVNFDLAVVLISNKYELETTEEKEEGKLTFIFIGDENIKSLIQQYWSNKLLVDPLEFSNKRENLKSRLFGMKKSY